MLIGRAWRHELRATCVPYPPRLLLGFDRSDLTHQGGGPGDPPWRGMIDTRKGRVLGLILYTTRLYRTGIEVRPQLRLDLNHRVPQSAPPCVGTSGAVRLTAGSERLAARLVAKAQEEEEGRAMRITEVE